MSPISFHIRERGFTFLEVIAVLVIVGVIAAVVVERNVSTGTYSLAAEEDILKTHLRYAQYRALSDDKTWSMSFAVQSYSIGRDGDVTIYKLPNEDSATHALPSDISFSPMPSKVTFDAWGSPVDAGGIPVTDNIAIILVSGGESRTFTITKNTGFIP